MTDITKHTGSCLCGAIKFVISGKLREVVNCHCGQCRKAHGHFAAYSAVPRDQISFLNDQGLTWYKSSEHARRGFCRECGSSLFWDRLASDTLCVAAGSLDQPTGLISVRHIFVDDAGDYYEIEDSLEKFPGTMGENQPG